MLALVWLPACNPSSIGFTTDWPVSGKVAEDALRNTGFRCTEEGRELYPALYACTLVDESRSGGIYLYADDRNELVGIRAFSSDSSTYFFDQALDLAFPSRNLGNQLTFDPSEQKIDLADDILVETGRSDDVRYLRITPRNKIHVQ